MAFNISEKIGGIIRDYRKAAGMTQEELGALLGMSRQMVSRIEGGHNAVAPDTVVRLYEVLGISPNVLFDCPGEMRTEEILRHASFDERRLIDQIVKVVDEEYHRIVKGKH